MYSYSVLSRKYNEIKEYNDFLIKENEKLHKQKDKMKKKIKELEKSLSDLGMLLKVKIDKLNRGDDE